MKVHEFQAKSVLAGFGVPVPRGDVADSPSAARAVAERLGSPVVVKAQIHAGGRGLAGGIKTAATPAEAETSAASLLGSVLVTPQTGPRGKRVRLVLVEEAVDAARELYLSLAVDPSREAVVIMASAGGGVGIEEAAALAPGFLYKEYVPAGGRLQDSQGRGIASALGLEGKTFEQGVKVVTALYRAFEATDASLVEINPLAVTRQGDLLALDARMTFDDNALGRRPDVRALRDPGEESPLEVEASRSNLSYVKLDGDVGCMVNGAGLAMATMDLIQQAGGRPANFLDVGGGVTEAAAADAFKILASDPGVKGALINIFGGIVRCDTIAAGVVKAARETGARIPIVVRLEGTNAGEGKAILRASGLAFHQADGMRAAAEKIVSLVSASGRQGSGA